MGDAVSDVQGVCKATKRSSVHMLEPHCCAGACTMTMASLYVNKIAVQGILGPEARGGRVIYAQV